MSNNVWIGCDISKNVFWIALAKVEDSGVDWVKLPHCEFNHTERGVADFIAWLADFGVGEKEVAGICLEATGRYSLQWVTLLDERLGEASIVNPAAPKAFKASLGVCGKPSRHPSVKSTAMRHFHIQSHRDCRTGTLLRMTRLWVVALKWACCGVRLPQSLRLLRNDGAFVLALFVLGPITVAIMT